MKKIFENESEMPDMIKHCSNCKQKMRLIDANELLQDMILRHDSIQKHNFIDVAKDDEWLVETAPTVEAEPIKHGRWIYLFLVDYPKVRLFQCTNCKAHIRHTTENIYNYCPNCGVKMDG